jgi:hypothetical protein
MRFECFRMLRGSQPETTFGCLEPAHALQGKSQVQLGRPVEWA